MRCGVLAAPDLHGGVARGAVGVCGGAGGSFLVCFVPSSIISKTQFVFSRLWGRRTSLWYEIARLSVT